MGEKILIVEDEEVLLETLAYNLKKEGYTVETADNGVDGLRVARDWHPELILLDVMLPQLDGFEVCKILRAETDIPILMVTARSEEIDRVIGFEIGADDYILKPFSMRELIARVKTRLKAYRRIHTPESEKVEVKTPNEIVVGNLVIDQKRHEIRIDNNLLTLKPRELDLLCYLVENRGRAVTREMILKEVWGWDYFGGSRTVDVHIRWLRSKIEVDPSKPTRLVTVPGMGYRFEG